MPTITLATADKPFDICWDKAGLAHVFSATKADAFRGMGYACASERLWQIHLSTLFATGTVASVLGPKYVAQDLLHQSFNVPAYDLPASPGDWVVDAYLEGLNAYVSQLDELPAEFKYAGCEPKIYTRADVASRYRFTGWLQHKSWLEKLAVGKLMARHGSDWFKNLVVRFSAQDAAAVEELKEALLAIDLNIAKLLFPSIDINSGSNNWAVSSALSASGMPMLATDPHQPHSLPNTFFYCHLSAPEWDTFGASFPGVPYFMMGFNRQLAWGLTTAFVDTYDVYIERETAMQQQRYAIDVAKQSRQDFTIDIGKHGPILESLSDNLGYTKTKARPNQTALYWSMRDQPTSAGVLGLLPLADNAQQFGEALFENNVCPLVNNIICVDRHNDMRRFMAATLPKRVGVTGTVPLPGWQPELDFELSTAEDLLLEHNPKSGYTLTANNDTTGENWAFPIHNFPACSARSDRIDELLNGQNDFTSEYFEAMQADLKDLRAQEWAPGIVKALTAKSQPIKHAKKLLSQWDYCADITSTAAALYYPFIDKKTHIKFMHQVLGDDLILALPVIAPGLNRFSYQHFFNAGSPWLAHKTVLENISNQVMADLMANLDAEFGVNASLGDIQKIQFSHSLSKKTLAGEPLWQHIQVGPEPIAGSSTTLAMAAHFPARGGSEGLTVYHGPAFRWVVDLADPMHFRMIIAGGNGGSVDSKYNSNQFDDWLHGRYINVSLVRSEIEFAD